MGEKGGETKMEWLLASVLFCLKAKDCSAYCAVISLFVINHHLHISAELKGARV